MDWIAVLLNIVGLIVLAKHKIPGMYIFCASSTAFLIWAITNHVWSIAYLQIILLILNIRVIMMWRRL